MTQGDSTIVRFEDVSLHFGATAALDHVSFEMRPGETFVLLGAAGSGKTMLLKVAVGLVRPDSQLLKRARVRSKRCARKKATDLA